MSNKVGRTIENRVDWGRWLVASVETHGEHVAAKLDGRSGLDEGQWKSWLEGQRDELAAATEALYEAELALARERADDPEHREERDRLADVLYGAVVRSRSLMESVREGQARRFGLDGSTPRTPKSLEVFSRNAVEALREAGESFGSLGMTVDTTALADELQAPYEALRDKLVELQGEEREAEGLLIERNEVLDEWESVYQAVARMLQGAYRLAGEAELADRVRPTVTRSSGAEGPEDADVDAEDVPEPTDDGDEPDAPVVDVDADDEPEPADA